MASVTILAGHPYFDLEKPAVWQQSWDKRWTVRWRDFHTVKQGAEFDTKEEAEAFASTLCKPPMTVHDDACDLADSDQFWRDMAKER